MSKRDEPGLQNLHRSCFFACLCVFGLGREAIAAENGAGFYLLGSKGQYAAILPPEGVYFQNDLYIYGGTLGGSRSLPIAGKIAANVHATLVAELPTFLWSTDVSILGGRLAFSATEPIGGPSINADITLGPLHGTTSDNAATFGDPILGQSLAWDFDKFHVMLSNLVNVPIGNYRADALANLAFHHWGDDVSVAATWFDMQSGIEVSGIAGLTFNAENPATQYRTGTEFHFEGSVSKALSKEWSAGVIGYFYDQISGDGGSGARLGPFQGRTAALGGSLTYNFLIDKRPITVRAKVFREFDVERRLQGTGGYLTVAFPLYVAEKGK